MQHPTEELLSKLKINIGKLRQYRYKLRKWFKSWTKCKWRTNSWEKISVLLANLRRQMGKIGNILYKNAAKPPWKIWWNSVFFFASLRRFDYAVCNSSWLRMKQTVCPCASASEINGASAAARSNPNYLRFLISVHTRQFSCIVSPIFSKFSL